MTAGLHDTPLMEREGAEITSSKTSAAARETETDFLNGRHTAKFLIVRMICAGIRIGINIIHLLCRQRFGGRVLHDKYFIWIGLY